MTQHSALACTVASVNAWEFLLLPRLCSLADIFCDWCRIVFVLWLFFCLLNDCLIWKSRLNPIVSQTLVRLLVAVIHSKLKCHVRACASYFIFHSRKSGLSLPPYCTTVQAFPRPQAGHLLVRGQVWSADARDGLQRWRHPVPRSGEQQQ